MNKVILIGRLVADPEIFRKTTTFARCRIAVERQYKREGQPESDFFSLICFGTIATFAEKYLVKGRKIAVEGRLQSSSYTTKEGAKASSVDIIVDHFEFCESKNTTGAARSAAYPAPQVPASSQGYSSAGRPQEYPTHTDAECPPPMDYDILNDNGEQLPF